MDKPLLIHSTKEYKEKLKEVERLVALDPELDSIDGIRLNFLASQVEMYEKLHFDTGAKLAQARKIREEVCEFLDVQLLSMEYMTPPTIKSQLTKIIKRNL